MKYKIKTRNKIAMAIAAMLISSYASAQVTDQQIKDFFASNPSAEQIAATAASLGMTASQISAAMGVANFGGNQATREANISSWVGNASNGYSWNAQGQLVKGAAVSVPDPVGVNQASLDKGVWSPVERRWISNDELRAFGATKPSQDQMMQQAIKLGLNPQAVDYAAYVISGASNIRDPKYADLVHQMNTAMYSGQYGYGYDDSFSQGAALVKGNGTVHYKMPDSSEVAVRIHNGVPDQSYAQVLAEYYASKGQSSNGQNAGQNQFQLDTSWQNGCYPSAATAPAGAKICSAQGSNASVPIPIAQSSNSYLAQSQAQSGSTSKNTEAQIAQSLAGAAMGAVGEVAKSTGIPRVCPVGMTVTMTKAGIRKCVGTMIHEIPTEIPMPKGGTQHSTQTQQAQQTQQPAQQWIRPENIQAHEYVGGQLGASTSTQGFLIEGANMLTPPPEEPMSENELWAWGVAKGLIPPGWMRGRAGEPGAKYVDRIGWIAPNDRGPAIVGPEMPWTWTAGGGRIPAGFIRAEPNTPGAMFLEGAGWIVANGKSPAIEGPVATIPPGEPIPNEKLWAWGVANGLIPPGWMRGRAGEPGAKYVDRIGWIAPNDRGPYFEPVATIPPGERPPGSWVGMGSGHIPAGYMRAEPNTPGAKLVEGIGWIVPRSEVERARVIANSNQNGIAPPVVGFGDDKNPNYIPGPNGELPKPVVGFGVYGVTPNYIPGPNGELPR